MQRALTEAKTELARLKGLLESERNRSDELAKRCDDQERMLQGSAKVTVVDNSKVQELEELQEKIQQEVDAQAERMSKMIKDLAAGKSYDLGRSRKDPSKVFPKLDEAISDLDKLFAKIAKDTPQVVEKVSGDGGESLARAQKEIQQLKQEIAALKSKLAAAEQTYLLMASATLIWCRQEGTFAESLQHRCIEVLTFEPRLEVTHQ